MAECPNKDILVLNKLFGEYELHDEEETKILDDEIEYAEEGEILMIQRVLNAEPTLEERAQRDNLFHTRCTVKDKVCHLIVDSDSCANIASTLMVEKLGLETTKNPRPYKLTWLNDDEELKVSQQVQVRLQRPYSV